MRTTIVLGLATLLVASVAMAQQTAKQSAEPAAEKIVLSNAGGDGDSPERTWSGAPISLSLKDADVSEVLRTLAREFDLNVVIQPGAPRPTTVELDQVPWDQALDAILRVNGLVGEQDERVLKVRPVEPGEKPGLRV